MSSGAPPEPAPTFFTDRPIGRRDVPTALRAVGASVVIHDDVLPQNTPDATWLQRAGSEGWVVITRDKRIRHRWAEREALIESGAIVFVITARNLTGPRMADLVVRALPHMRQISAQVSRPAIYTIGASGTPKQLDINEPKA